MKNTILPPVPINWKMVRVYLKGKETGIQTGGELDEIELMKQNFVNRTGNIVKVGHDLIDTSEISAICD